MRWDWYATTIPDGSPQAIADDLLEHFDLSDYGPAKALNGYERGGGIYRGDTLLARILWGGNPGVHVVGTGENSPIVAEAAKGWDHYPTRVDGCRDWVEPGRFDDWAAILMEYAADRGIAINQQGDWKRGQSRTLYLGSPASTCRLVLYEKGWQMGADPNWVRLEIRVRPAKHAKFTVAHWEPVDVEHCSNWVAMALYLIGWDKAAGSSVGTVWRPSDAERARRALVKQYGAILAKWSEEVGGWQELGEDVERRLLEQCSG